MESLLLAQFYTEVTAKLMQKLSPSENVNFIQISPALFALFCRILVVFMNKKVLQVKHESI